MLRVLGVPLDRCHLLGWGNIICLAHHIADDPASFVWREEHKDESNYRDALQANALLADLYDQLAALAYMYAVAHKGNPRKPKRYPRPWSKDTQRIGRGAIPISQFDAWYYGGENG